MTENDPKLKLAVARMLPERLEITQIHRPGFGDTPESIIDIVWWKGCAAAVLETEWLYIVALASKTLVDLERRKYAMQLAILLHTDGEFTPSPIFTRNDFGWISCFDFINATFNQRATALCKVKGIEP